MHTLPPLLFLSSPYFAYFYSILTGKQQSFRYVLTLSKCSLFKTWHFNISNCDHCYSSLMWNIWWLIHSILGHSPICSALSPCSLGPFGSCVSFTCTVPSAWKCSCFSPSWPRLYTSSFRLQTLPDTYLLPSQVSYDSSLGLYLYFTAFISVLKLFIYIIT